MKTGSWTYKSGSCALVALMGYKIKIIEAGHGEYASMQRPPSGYYDDELTRVARAAVKAVRKYDGSSIQYLNAALPLGARILNGTNPTKKVIEVKVRKRIK